jgi:hypothetical protein
LPHVCLGSKNKIFKKQRQPCDQKIKQSKNKNVVKKKNIKGKHVAKIKSCNSKKARQEMLWPNEKVQKDIQRSTKHYTEN